MEPRRLSRRPRVSSLPARAGAICLPGGERIWWPRFPARAGRGLCERHLPRDRRRASSRQSAQSCGRATGAMSSPLAVLALLIAGGVVAWRDHQLSERQAQSARYAGALALARAGKTADAAIVFALDRAARAAATRSSPRSRTRPCGPNRAIARAPWRSMTASPRRAASIPPFAIWRSCYSVMQAHPRPIRRRRSPVWRR